MLEKITPAKITWNEKDVPYSDAFGDLYFSADNGLEESRYVFIEGNRLPERWTSLRASDQFVICETGFGSGLNLLASADLWSKTAPDNARLQFISIEQFPMRRADIARALNKMPSIDGLAQRLLEQYPSLTPGYRHFDLMPNISVTLVFDEIESGLRSLCPPLEPQLWHQRPYTIDAWFLDGFAPAKNPSMWGDALFPLINRLSKTETSFATFTAAGDVRRGLERWGFHAKKQAGFGKKRDMLVGVFDVGNEVDLTPIHTAYKKPAPCWMLPDSSPTSEEDVIAIIGAGIAGATLAHSLAQRGRRVHIYDAGEAPGINQDISIDNRISRASDISQVALYARLSPEAGDLGDFALSALNYSQRYYKRIFAETHENECGRIGDLCGLVQLPRDEKELENMQRLAKRVNAGSDFVTFESAEILSDRAGIKIDSEGLLFPNSGWLNGAKVCTALLSHNHINVTYEARLTDFCQLDDNWQLYLNGELCPRNYSTLVFCSAMAAKQFAPFDWLPVKPIRGQVSFFNPPPEFDRLSTVLCRDIQVIPANEGMMSTGSSYVLNSTDTDINDAEHASNLAKLAGLVPTRRALQATNGQAQIRCTTPDYVPISGYAPNLTLFLEQFAALRKDAKSQLPHFGPAHAGVFLNLGFGSRGYTYAPLCAEHLARQICGEVPAVPDYLNRAMQPARFLIRGLARNQL